MRCKINAPAVLARSGRHVKTSITLDINAHVLPGMQVAIAETIGRLLFAPKVGTHLAGSCSFGPEVAPSHKYNEASPSEMPQNRRFYRHFWERGTGLEPATACLEGVSRFTLWHRSRFSRHDAVLSTSSLSASCPVMVS